MIRTFTASILGLVLLSAPVGVPLASGGGGFDQGFSQRKVDKIYESGKTYFKAKTSSGSVLNYCVQSGAELRKLSKRSLKPLRKSTAQALTSSLYNCDVPDQLVIDVIGEEKMPAIIHYLNKRYKLKLVGNS